MDGDRAPGQTGAVTSTMLLTGGRVHSPSAPDATAMAITDGMVVWVGQDGPGRALHPDAEELPLDGAFVAPAFVDAHVHATATGLHLAGLDLTGVRDADELLFAVREAAGRLPSGEVLIAHGWDETSWPAARIPSRAQLDAAVGSRPAYLSRIDVHSTLVSSGLADLVPAARTADGWSDDGPVRAAAHHHLRAAARAAITPQQRTAAQRAFLRAAAAQGIVSVHECAGPDISGWEDLDGLLELADRPDLPEVVPYWGEPAGPELLDRAKRSGVRGLVGDLFVDGALGSRTACLSEPYADDPGSRGVRYLEPEQIAAHVVACTNAGLQAGFHVIGDGALVAVIAGFEQAEAVIGHRAIAAGRHRLEHLEMVDATQAKALARWNVTASVQPVFDALWGGGGMYAQRLGPQRAAAMNPYSMLAAEGVLLAAGSDTPVTPLDPWSSVRAAVQHHTPGSGISARAAFAAHTKAGHRAAGVADGVTGTLVPGAPAHFAVWAAGDLVVTAPDARVQRWSTDPRSRVPGLPSLAPDAELPRCLRTVRAGITLFEA